MHTPEFPLCKNEFAERIKSARLRKGLSQQEVADRLGKSDSSYIRYESAKSDTLPRLPEFVALCEILDCYPLYLLTGRNEPYKNERITDRLFNFYTRYKSERDFTILITYLLKMDEKQISKLSDFIMVMHQTK